MTVMIIDNYDSFTFNLAQAVREIGQASCRVGDSEPGPEANEFQEVPADQKVLKVQVVRNDQLTFAELKELEPSAIIISPGPGRPDREADFGINREVIQRQEELGCPVLGVCLGHQGIAHFLGGRVTKAPQVMHGRASLIVVDESVPSRLFQGMPRRVEVMRYHSLVVEEKSLPKELRVTARAEEHGEVMAIEHRELSLFGVQFHPESIGTPSGQSILRNFLSLC